MERRLPQASRVEALLHKRSYTLRELAELLEVDPSVIRYAVHSSELQATTIGRDIVSISRQQVLDWLGERPQKRA